MHVQVGVGYSLLPNSQEAAKEAARLAVAQSGPPVLTFLFTTERYNQTEILEAVIAETGTPKLVGASGAGIVTVEGIKKHGVGVVTIAGEGITAETALVEMLPDRADETGRKLAEKLLRGSAPDEGTVFVFPDGLSGNIARMLRGIYDVLGPQFKYAGGGTGDNMRFLRTYQMTETGVASGAVAAALVAGCSFATGIGHGWEPFGSPLLITRARGKIVFEIDEQPAFQVYSRRLEGITSEEFPFCAVRYPLGIPDITGKFIIRDPFKLGADGSIEFVTEVPPRAVAYLMRYTRVENLLQTALGATMQAQKTVRTPQFALIFNCVSRAELMGEHANREVEIIRNTLGGLPMAGFLTFGEVGSYGSGVPLFHNKTFLIAVGGTSLL
ncbi:MAG: FIST C-terminal domain-containing protein [Firmicutes bacterium]|nr:FIST C-terminal domain-containing protein [Bacillota bacterium]